MLLCDVMYVAMEHAVLRRHAPTPLAFETQSRGARKYCERIVAEAIAFTFRTPHSVNLVKVRSSALIHGGRSAPSPATTPRTDLTT